jgi:XTP/dITP diphosphohydrolase
LQKRILLATNNQHKLKQMRAILEPLGFETPSPRDSGFIFEVDEPGSSFEENARIKAEGLSAMANARTLADDSGLIVDALNGEPGIYSARYGGPYLTDDERVDLVLERMNGVPEVRRTARYVAAIAIAEPASSTTVFQATVEGSIHHEPIGTKGFGYDPIFFYPPAGRTFGQMEWEEKAGVSHRGKALRAVVEFLLQSKT